LNIFRDIKERKSQSSATDSVTTTSSTTNQLTSGSATSNNSSSGYNDSSLEDFKYSNEFRSSYERDSASTPLKVSENHKRTSQPDMVKKSTSSVSTKSTNSERDRGPKVRHLGLIQRFQIKKYDVAGNASRLANN